MSYQYRPKRVLTRVCDLCGVEIPDTVTKQEFGSLMGGVVESEACARTPTSNRSHVKLKWPPAASPRLSKDYRQEKRRNYDFHGECIVRLIEANLFDFDEEVAT